MPRYHYNVFGENSVLDDEGFEFKDAQQARREALRYAAGIVLEDAGKNICPDKWRLEVTDTDGAILFRIDLSITALPAKSEGCVPVIGAVPCPA